MAYDSSDFVVEQPVKALPVVPQDDPIERTLREAKDLILEKGWGQRAFCDYDANGHAYNYCILGALRDATHNIQGDGFDTESEYWRAYRGAEDVMEKCIPWYLRWFGFCNGVISFNDHFATKKGEVIELFDKAIKRRVKQVAKGKS